MSSSPTPLQRAGPSSTGSGCSEPRPTWPWMLPGMGHLPPLWATCANASPPSSFWFETIALCPIATGPAKSLSPSFLQAPFKYWKAAIRSLHSLLFSRLNSPKSLYFSSQQRGSSPRIIVVTSSGPSLTGLWLSCAKGSRAGTSTWG